MSLTREWHKQIYAYLEARFRQPQKIYLGGTSGSGGGTGYPPGGISGQLPQRYVCYDTTEATTAGSTPVPSLVHNLNRIRGGWAMGDEAIRERHMLWATGVWGTSGCISAWDVPYYSTSGCIPEESVHQAIEWLYSHRADDITSNYYTWHTFVFTIDGDLDVEPGSIRVYTPGDMTIDSLFASLGTPAVGADAIFDVNVNGASIGTVTVAAGAYTGTASPSDPVLETGDYLTVDVDQRGTTTPGANASVQAMCKQYLQED